MVAALADTYAVGIDAIVLDLTMSDFDAVGLLATMRAAGLPIPIIVQTRDDAIDKLAAAMRAGATDFVVKPVGAERLRVSLRNALFARALEAELARVRMGASAPPESAENPVIASSGGSFAPPLVPSLAAVAPPSGVLALLDGNGNVRALEDIEAERPSDSLSRITTVRRPRSRGGCASGASASSIRSGSMARFRT